MDKVIFADEALEKFIGLCKPEYNILDIGCGKDMIHTKIMREKGLNPKTIDVFEDSYFVGLYEEYTFFGVYFDAMWCSHVLEHILNVNKFLKKIRYEIKDNGVLAITVPPLKHEIVTGHVNLYNAGLLIYQLIMAGFDCSNAMIKTYGYNISVILPEVKKIPVPPVNIGIEELKQYFPMEVFSGFDGNIKELNWS